MSGYLLFVLVFFAILSLTGAAITPQDASYNAQVDQDFILPWEYDDETKMFSVVWSYSNSSATLATNIMSQSQGASAVPLKDYVEHIGNGKIKLLSVKKENSGIFYCVVTYDALSGLSPVTGTATLSVIDDDDDDGVKTETIVGSTLGAVAGAGVVAGAGLYARNRMRRNRKKKQQQSETERGESKKVNQKKEKGDTHLAENKNKTPRPQPPRPLKPLDNSPMPGITKSKDQGNNYGHDGKGRGLSANFDDHHHMTSINIPEKKAGALDPIHEKSGEQEQKKKKKKKEFTPRETSEEYDADN